MATEKDYRNQILNIYLLIEERMLSYSYCENDPDFKELQEACKLPEEGNFETVEHTLKKALEEIKSECENPKSAKECKIHEIAKEALGVCSWS